MNRKEAWIRLALEFRKDRGHRAVGFCAALRNLRLNEGAYKACKDSLDYLALLKNKDPENLTGYLWPTEPYADLTRSKIALILSEEQFPSLERLEKEVEKFWL